MNKPSKTRQILANNIRNARLKLGLSQEHLADKVGLHRTYIGSVERAERNVTIDNIERIAKALGISVIELLKSD